MMPMLDTISAVAMADWNAAIPWQTGLLIVLSLGFLTTAGWLWGRLRRKGQAWGPFFAECGQLGIVGEERDMLVLLTNLAELRHPDAVFAAAHAFELGAAALIGRPRVQSLSDDGQRAIIAMLASLREKMGFQRKAESRLIPEGRKVRLSCRACPEGFDAAVSENRLNDLVLNVGQTIGLTEGEYCRVRYGNEGYVWEFDLPVTREVDGKVTLGHSDNGQSLNRRRFPRFACHREAFLAAFPFEAGTPVLSPPDFRPSTVVEIAGPGLRFDTTLEFRAGDRALVMVRLAEDRIVQAHGRVCRVLADENGQKSVAVELLTLSPQEVVELAHETFLAAREATGTTPAREAIVQPDSGKSVTSGGPLGNSPKADPQTVR